MRPRDFLPNLPHEGPPVPRFLTQARIPEHKQEAGGPGCRCADEVLTVLGHLNGLSEGWGGFGVLRTSRERLERAAEAAHELNEEELAVEIESIAEKLSLVTTESLAADAVSELKPIARRAWELGKHCKGTRDATSKALEALRMIKEGEIG